MGSDELLASVDNPFLTIDSDITASFHKDAEDVTMAAHGQFMSMSSDDGDLFPFDSSLSIAEPNDYCEVFTDLSSLLQETEMNFEGTASSGNGEEVRVAPKRKANEADPGSAVNVDHADYTIKSKRCKTSTDESENMPVEKDEKYLERRMKNNIASRRSRETRKQKHSEMELKAIELEKRNEELRVKVSELERLTKEMKDILVQKLAVK